MIEITSQTSHKGQGYDEPYRALAAAIIISAVKDVRSKKSFKRISALSFFRSGWFELLSDAVDIRPDVIRQKLGLVH